MKYIFAPPTVISADARAQTRLLAIYRSTGGAFQNIANFELTYLNQFLIVVELFDPPASSMLEVHFDRTNLGKILVSWVSTRAI